MPKTRNVYQEGTKIKSMCRVCLTQSNYVMFKLTDSLQSEKNLNAVTYLEALEKTTNSRVAINGKFPESICPMCVSFLKMALQFINQFKDSQKKLEDMFKKFTPAYLHTLSTEENVPTAKKIRTEENSENSSPVELIVKNQKYNLNDVVLVENIEMEEDGINGFINKLGKEISATLINNKNIDNDISIIKVETDEESNTDNEIDENDQEQIVTTEPQDIEVQIEHSSDREDSSDEVIKCIIEDYGENENIEYVEIKREDSDQPDDQDPEVDTEGYDDTESKNGHSEPDNFQYIELDVLDKNAIESLIIDRKESNDQEIVQPRKRRKTKKKEVRDEFEREVQFPCGTCKKVLPSLRSLKTHERRVHLKLYEKDFTCEVCGAVCKTRSKFVNHKLTHVEKQFQCEQCDKRYSTKAHLKVHMGVHENARPYLCNVCGKDFNYANALSYHMRLHTGEKNFYCEYCPKRFRMVNSLNRHIRTHTGEKPYQCQYCERCFSSKGEVVCHEYIHTGYRPYHCKYCKKGFSKTHNLKIHLLSHGGPFQCKYCIKSFIEQNILNMHYRITHKDQITKSENENSGDSSEDIPNDDQFHLNLDQLDEDSTVEYIDGEEYIIKEIQVVETNE